MHALHGSVFNFRSFLNILFIYTRELQVHTAQSEWKNTLLVHIEQLISVIKD